METINIVIDEASNSGSEKVSEEIPKEIVDQEPTSPSTPGVVEGSADIPTSPDFESHGKK